MGGSGSKIDSRVNTKFIEDEVHSHPVVVYSKKSCGFCTKAKNLLQQNNVEYHETDLDELNSRKNVDGTSVVNGLVYTTRVTSVPQIFICSKFIGGYTELAKLVEEKQLKVKVGECTGENAKQW